MLSWPGYSRQGFCQAIALLSVTNTAATVNRVFPISPTPSIILT